MASLSLWLLFFGATPGAANDAIVMGPVLMFPSPSQISIRWQLDLPYPRHRIEYGRTPALGKTATKYRFTHAPLITLTGLQPGSTYYYRVHSQGFPSSISTFTTLQPEKPEGFRLGIWGDNQRGIRVFSRQTIPTLLRQAPDAVLSLGDVVQSGTLYADWRDQLFLPAAPLLSKIGWFPVRGNHDGEDWLAKEMMPFPTKNSWYTQSLGPLLLIVLNSNLSLRPGSDQYSWLWHQMLSPAWQNARFRAVAFHHAGYSNFWGDSSGYDGTPEVRNFLIPLLEWGGTDIVLNGHAHYFDYGVRSHAKGKTHYFILGGGGGPVDTVPSGTWPHLTRPHNRHHVGILDILDDKITLQAIDSSTQEVFESIELEAPRQH